MTDPLTPEPTVFIVDDDPSIRRAMSRLFASFGLASETYDGAADFLARAPRNGRGCIILDIRMPGLTGLELQRHLLDERVEWPVIFVTAHADIPLAVRAVKDGAVEVFTKPFDEQKLMDAVRQALMRDSANHQLRRELVELTARYRTLTNRQRTVMELVVAGHPNKQVAAMLGTSLKTVKVHRGQVMRKMCADSLAQLVRMSVRLASDARRP